MLAVSRRVCTSSAACSTLLYLRIQQFLRPRLVDVGQGDQVGAGVDERRDLFALGGGESRLDPVIAHPERILHNERRDHAVLQKLYQLVVAVEAAGLDLGL